MSQTIAESSSSLQSLATQPTIVDTEKYYCPFQERGFCRDSARCNFSHDCHASIKVPPEYCHFYLANQCLFGQDCKFLHSEPADDNTSLSNIVDPNSGQDGGSLAGLTGGGDCDDYLEYNNGSSGRDYEYDTSHVASDATPAISSADKDIGTRYITIRGLRSSECDEADNIYNTTSLDHSQNNSSHRSDSAGENDQPSSSSTSRLKAVRISRRCAMTTPSTSTTIIAKLKLPANLAAQNQSKSSNSPTNEGKTNVQPPATAPKSSWQGARLIASIRNNLGISDQPSSSTGHNANSSATNDEHGLKDLPLCPYSVTSGECPFPDGHCGYLHGLVCDLCYSACLHPYNEEQRHQHREECLREHEREMELSFAVQRSKDKVCGVCMETVVEKKPVTSSRFGILEKCNHIFCLDCIRKWRGTKQFDSRTIRACPECRTSSDFVIPSKYWVEDQNDKERLISDYKAALKSKPCRYFNEGRGDCPFAGSCFYKHAYPDGRLAVMDAPKPRRRLYGARGPTTSVANYILWNILTSTDEDELSENEIQSLSETDELDMPDFIDSDLEEHWQSRDGFEM